MMEVSQSHGADEIALLAIGLAHRVQPVQLAPAAADGDEEEDGQPDHRRERGAQQEWMRNQGISRRLARIESGRGAAVAAKPSQKIRGTRAASRRA